MKWIFQRDIGSPAVPNLLSAKHSTAAMSIASRVRTVTGVSRDLRGQAGFLDPLDSEDEDTTVLRNVGKFKGRYGVKSLKT